MHHLPHGARRVLALLSMIPVVVLAQTPRISPSRPAPIHGQVGVERAQPPGQPVSSAHEVPAPKDWQDLPTGAGVVAGKPEPPTDPKPSSGTPAQGEADRHAAQARHAHQVQAQRKPASHHLTANAAAHATVEGHGATAGRGHRASAAAHRAEPAIVRHRQSLARGEGAGRHPGAQAAAKAHAEPAVRASRVGRVRHGQVVQDMSDEAAARKASRPHRIPPGTAHQPRPLRDRHPAPSASKAGAKAKHAAPTPPQAAPVPVGKATRAARSHAASRAARAGAQDKR